MEFHKVDRIIILVDMDCFYVQVEQKLNPEYKEKPCAVVQYNTWKGGGIIAVNYEARANGVLRRHRGQDAQKLCPDIHLFRVPEVRGKADLTRYREAGASVLEVLCKFSDCVERASIDEAYLDVTQVIDTRMLADLRVTPDQISNTFVTGWPEDDHIAARQNWLDSIYEEDHLYNDRRLALAAVLAEEMRAAVYAETGYRCSAGIAHNKMLAKLSCGLHKPNKQTVTPESSIPTLYKTLPINKVRNLGGKFGEQAAQKFNAKTMADLLALPKPQFINAFGEKTGTWLFELSRGIDTELVTSRQLPKSIGCGKNFPGKNSLSTKEKVMHWTKQLATELEERLLKDQENNRRIAKTLTISIRNKDTSGYSVVSKSCPIHVYNAEKISHDAYTALQRFNTSAQSSPLWEPAILSLAMSAGRFEDKADNSTCDIQSYFKNSVCQKKNTNSVASLDENTSEIDTVIGLLDNEADLSSGPDSKLKIISAEVETSKRRSNDISSFFNLKSDSSNVEACDSKPNSNISLDEHCIITEPVFDNCKAGTSKESDNSSFLNGKYDSLDVEAVECKTNSKNAMSAISEFNITSTTDDKNVHINNNNLCIPAQSDSNEPKRKGFFARKLEERKLLLAENAYVCGVDSESEQTKMFNHIDNKNAVQNWRTKNGASEPPILCKLEELKLLLGERASGVIKNESSGNIGNKNAVNDTNVVNIACEPSITSEQLSAQKPTTSFSGYENKETDCPGNSTIENAAIDARTVNGRKEPSIANIFNKNTQADLDPELTYLCSKCNCRIALWEEEEHTDYHFALDLSKELRKDTFKPVQSTSDQAKGTLSKSTKTCKKRGNASKITSKSKKPNQKNTLDSFFK